MPEGLCQRCKQNYMVWFTHNDLWNRYCDKFNFLCPSCFSFLAEQHGCKTTGWVLVPEERAAKSLEPVALSTNIAMQKCLCDKCGVSLPSSIVDINTWKVRTDHVCSHTT